ncbi:MAG: hypothetical protein QM499_09800 [Flavobacteriaceae bacterium]
MKNLLSIITFAFVMMLSTQNVSAQNLSQNQERPEVAAKAELHDLTNQLNLTGDQGRTLYRALVTKEVSYRKSAEANGEKSPQLTSDMKKADAVFYAEMKKVLKDDQFKKWISSLKK